MEGLTKAYTYESLLILFSVIIFPDEVVSWGTKLQTTNHISGWIPMRSQDNSLSYHVWNHNLNDLPIRVDVQVKPQTGSDTGYFFPGIAAAQRDDSMALPYGGIVYKYNKDSVMLYAPNKHSGKPSGNAIYTGYMMAIESSLNGVKWGGVPYAYDDKLIRVWTRYMGGWIFIYHSRWLGNISGNVQVWPIQNTCLEIIESKTNIIQKLNLPSSSNTELKFSQTINQNRDIMQVMVKELPDTLGSNQNRGLFKATGAVQNTLMGTSYGGVVYSYSNQYIRVWYPPVKDNGKTYLIYLDNLFGKSSLARTAQLEITTFVPYDSSLSTTITTTPMTSTTTTSTASTPRTKTTSTTTPMTPSTTTATVSTPRTKATSTTTPMTPSTTTSTVSTPTTKSTSATTKTSSLPTTTTPATTSTKTTLIDTTTTSALPTTTYTKSTSAAFTFTAGISSMFNIKRTCFLYLEDIK
ncbi:unnamed protein product [Mytilus edulis]|uniref:Uncharacterized protein n=1 Tax=Mytilus edulis TaxID=6550 RepID=A0A8S3UAQ8_MYTED|nr:unnamed protein product [Mytilus edulis]